MWIGSAEASPDHRSSGDVFGFQAPNDRLLEIPLQTLDEKPKSGDSGCIGWIYLDDLVTEIAPILATPTVCSIRTAVPAVRACPYLN